MPNFGYPIQYLGRTKFQQFTPGAQFTDNLCAACGNADGRCRFDDRPSKSQDNYCYYRNGPGRDNGNPAPLVGRSKIEERRENWRTEQREREEEERRNKANGGEKPKKKGEDDGLADLLKGLSVS